MDKQQLLDAFRNEICSRVKEIDDEYELDWYDFSVGFFLARNPDLSLAHECAREARYTHHYWC